MNIMFLVIFFPLFSFLFLSCSQGFISLKKIKIIGINSVLISFIITIFYIVYFFFHTSNILTQPLWTLISIDRFHIDLGLFLDGLSLSMLCVVTGIGFLMHLFSSWYMENEEGYSRFFAYTNLFIASMLILVLSDSLFFMYFGWEGVSICSYLLIGFYYKKIENSYCALKAFILTRISDVFLIIAFFLIYQKYHTFNFQEIKYLITSSKIEYSSILNEINIFLLLGVIGKSAQLPLQTWLTSAMVGPTPVSALIHAATMVTAGIYLIARTHFLFLYTPDVLNAIGIIGLVTIVLSSFSALVQSDIKRILAYSTMSQIGYMFLALSVQAWSVAIVHLFVHAIFKALLFLSAGSVILACNNEKNIFKMNATYKKMPFLYINFLIAGGSLVSFPLITSGFYSKGNILFSVLNSGHIYYFLIALFCSFLTAIYTFRMIFVLFHKKNFSNIIVSKKIIFPRFFHDFPLFILLLGSTFLGSFISLPLTFVFPLLNHPIYNKWFLEVISSTISLFGIFLAYYFWIRNNIFLDKIKAYKINQKIHSIIFHGWGFDWIYNLIFIKLYLFISKVCSFDIINILNNCIIFIIQRLNKFLLKYNNGHLKWYIKSMMLGIIFIFLCIFYFSN